MDGRKAEAESGAVETRRTAGKRGPGKCGVCEVSTAMVLDLLRRGGASDLIGQALAVSSTLSLAINTE